MLSNLNFLDYVIILPGVLICLKRIAEMQRYHILRVVIITSILSIVVIHFFLVFGQTFGIGKQFDCVPDGIHFTETEM